MTDHQIKAGDTPTLRWSLGRDLAGWACRVIISRRVGVAPHIVETPVVVDVETGLIELTLTAEQSAITPGRRVEEWAVEVETTSNSTVLTHPSDSYGKITVRDDLDVAVPEDD